MFADDQRAHVETGHQIRGAEHERLHPRARRDRVDVGQSGGVLDLRLDADAPHRQPVRRLQLRQQKIQRVDV